TVSEAVALAVVDLLADYGVEAKIKWPNDIYVDDRKICGILIENAITPREILYTIAGIGVNLNQERFMSDAPNPVSLTQLTGCEYDLSEAAAILANHVEKRMAMTVAAPDQLHKEFMSKMWRADGDEYPFFDCLRGEGIKARISDVASDGIITLDLGNECRSYAFKEIEFLLS
ncbi:MAG: biotin--[acetyl-CoA-carboxylase] ligase, partial [Muribaculaceae bacterium]|nr:biotin--[acetyl-CoA-carboxylase] ligase [Muribaculaceae bacterium]